MKRIITLLLGIMLVSSTVFGAVNITNYTIDNDKRVFSVMYSADANDMVSVVAYDVTSIIHPTIDEPYVDEATTPMLGMWQEWSDGQFDLNIKESYTGRLMVVIGAYAEEGDRILLKVENGSVRSITIPNSLSDSFDADTSMKVLTDGDTVTISKDARLTNAIINASEGTLTIGTTSAKGRVSFAANGSITAEAGDTVLLESQAVDGKRNVGFILGKRFDTPASTRTLTVIQGNNSQSVTFKNTEIYEGTLVFGTAITNVPVIVSADSFKVDVE